MKKIYQAIIETVDAANFLKVEHDAVRIGDSLRLFEEEFDNGFLQLCATSGNKFNYRYEVNYANNSLDKMIGVSNGRTSEIDGILRSRKPSMMGAYFDPFGNIVKQRLYFQKKDCRPEDLSAKPFMGRHALPGCLEHISAIEFDLEKDSAIYYFSPLRGRRIDWRSIVAQFELCVPKGFQRDAFMGGASSLAVTVNNADEISRLCFHVPCCTVPEVPDELVDIYLYASNSERTYFIDFSFGKSDNDLCASFEWEIHRARRLG